MLNSITFDLFIPQNLFILYKCIALFLIKDCLFSVFGIEYCNENGADGVPVFSAPPSGGTTVPLREDSPVGHVVYILTASDTEYYVLNSMFPEFGITRNQIVVKGDLDYETRNQFTLNIR